MLAVAGLSVNSLSSVKSKRPAMELPDQPIRTLNTISPAVPSCRLRYCAERWLSVRPRTMRNVALRNVETSAAKYSTSRRCTTPRAMLEKCVTGLSACNSVATFCGNVTATMSSPMTISSIVVSKPRMNATIWLRVRLDVNSPMDTNAAASNNALRYCPTAAPMSKSPAVITAIGNPSVAMIANATNANPDRNLENSTVQPRIGCVRSSSSVPSRFSSASSRMVAAGTKIASSQGSDGFWIWNSTVNSGRNEASPDRIACPKNTSDSAATNGTMRMYAAGWSK